MMIRGTIVIELNPPCTGLNFSNLSISNAKPMTTFNLYHDEWRSFSSSHKELQAWSINAIGNSNSIISITIASL
jgi:hypothetical protein